MTSAYPENFNGKIYDQVRKLGNKEYDALVVISPREIPRINSAAEEEGLKRFYFDSTEQFIENLHLFEGLERVGCAVKRGLDQIAKFASQESPFSERGVKVTISTVY